MANKKYIDYPEGTYDPSKIFLQADPITGALEKVNLPSLDLKAIALGIFDYTYPDPPVGIFFYQSIPYSLTFTEVDPHIWQCDNMPSIPEFPELTIQLISSLDLNNCYSTYVSLSPIDQNFTVNIPPAPSTNTDPITAYILLVICNISF